MDSAGESKDNKCYERKSGTRVVAYNRELSRNPVRCTAKSH